MFLNGASNEDWGCRGEEGDWTQGFIARPGLVWRVYQTPGIRARTHPTLTDSQVVATAQRRRWQFGPTHQRKHNKRIRPRRTRRLLRRRNGGDDNLAPRTRGSTTSASDPDGLAGCCDGATEEMTILPHAPEEAQQVGGCQEGPTKQGETDETQRAWWRSFPGSSGWRQRGRRDMRGRWFTGRRWPDEWVPLDSAIDVEFVRVSPTLVKWVHLPVTRCGRAAGPGGRRVSGPG
jgi:hypothetical protein